MNEQKPQRSQRLLASRISAACAWLAVLLLVTTMVAAAPPKKKATKKKPSRPPVTTPVKNKPVPAYKTKKAVPPGQPFQALQRQIDALQEQVDAGEFEQLRVFNPDVNEGSTLFFGPTDDSNLSVDAPGGLTGLLQRDPVGLRLLGPGDQGGRLLFGPTDLCTVEVDPQGPAGLLLRDPGGIRILNPSAGEAATLLFGPSNECRIESGLGLGMIILDPDGLVVRSPVADAPNILSFGAAGPDGEQPCRIEVGGVDPNGGTLGMIFVDPEGFLFENDVDVNGAVVATGFIQSSSRRLKQDIRPIDDAMDKVSRLQGVYFNWKPAQGGQADVGFIAEEVQQVLPEAVAHGSDGVQGVKYGNVVALAIEGLKSQQQQIEQLQAKNTALEQQVSQLQASMDTLSAQVGQLLSAD